MKAEAYNFDKVGLIDSCFVRPIDPTKFEVKSAKELYNGNDDRPEPIYSIQRQLNAFTFYKGDGTKGGESILHFSRAKPFSTKSVAKFDHSRKEYEFKRPEGSMIITKTRYFEYDGVKFRYEMFFGKGRLFNTKTETVVAKYNYHAFKLGSQGNIIIFNPESMPQDLKILIIITSFEMYLLEGD